MKRGLRKDTHKVWTLGLLSNAFTFRKREELLQKSKECEREGKQEQAWKLKGQAIEVTYDHVVAFVKVREDVKIIRFFSCAVL